MRLEGKFPINPDAVCSAYAAIEMFAKLCYDNDVYWPGKYEEREEITGKTILALTYPFGDQTHLSTVADIPRHVREFLIETAALPSQVDERNKNRNVHVVIDSGHEMQDPLLRVEISNYDPDEPDMVAIFTMTRLWDGSEASKKVLQGKTSLESEITGNAEEAGAKNVKV